MDLASFIFKHFTIILSFFLKGSIILFLKNLNNNNNINVVVDQINNPTWTTAFSQAIRHCIIMNTRGLYHYGSDDNISRFEFAKLTANIFGLDPKLINPIKSKNLKQLALRPNNSSLNINKIIKEVGVQTYKLEYCLIQLKNSIFI